MLLTERERVIEELMEKCREVLCAKGKDYSGETDSLSNFKRNAERLGLTKYQVWLVYFLKHVDSVSNAIKAAPAFPQVESEPLEDRVIDIANYVFILAALIREDQALSVGVSK
jgi:hypothetical protein